MSLAAAFNRLLSKSGYYIAKRPGPEARLECPKDFEAFDVELWRKVVLYTMTSPERIYSLRRAVQYVVEAGIPGDFIECGVWKGGSSMAIALTLANLGVYNRELYLYDTFDAGWPEGGQLDVTIEGKSAHQLYLDAIASGETHDSLFANHDAVHAVMLQTGYPMEKIHLVKGKVEDTIPCVVPEKVGLLRLDTDWYDSTRHELLHLFPRLSPGGVLMLDDYGYFKGARQATDEYFSAHNVKMLLHRVDSEGYRIGIRL